jgi:hypothetical protein
MIESGFPTPTGCSAPVAVGQAGRAVGVADEEPPDLAGRKPENPRRLVERQAAGDEVVENVGAVPVPRIGLDLSVLGFHAPEGDKVTGRLRGDSFTGR